MSENRIERRRAPRARADLAIQLSDGGKAHDGRVRDLSSNGLACAIPVALSEMTLVGVGLQLPNDDRVHEVQGAVVRCAKLRGESPPTYEVAIYFTEISGDSRRAIQAFVESQLSQIQG